MHFHVLSNQFSYTPKETASGSSRTEESPTAVATLRGPYQSPHRLSGSQPAAHLRSLSAAAAAAAAALVLNKTVAGSAALANSTAGAAESMAAASAAAAAAAINQTAASPRPFHGDFFFSFQNFYWPIHCVVCLAICTLGIFANVTNIIVLTRPNMITAVNTILSAMAFSDLIVNASNIPYLIHELSPNTNMAQFYSYIWAVYTLFHAHITVTAHTISIWLTCVLATWRYCVVCRSQSSNQRNWSVALAKRTIVAVFLLVPIFCIPNYLSFAIVTETADHNATLHKVGFSHLADESKIIKTFHFWMFSCLTKLVPCMLLTFFTTFLIRKLLSARERRLRLTSFGNNDNHRAESSSSSITNKKQRTQQLPAQTKGAPHEVCLMANGSTKSNEQPSKAKLAGIVTARAQDEPLSWCPFDNTASIRADTRNCDVDSLVDRMSASPPRGPEVASANQTSANLAYLSSSSNCATDSDFLPLSLSGNKSDDTQLETTIDCDGQHQHQRQHQHHHHQHQHSTTKVMSQMIVESSAQFNGHQTKLHLAGHCSGSSPGREQFGLEADEAAARSDCCSCEMIDEQQLKMAPPADVFRSLGAESAARVSISEEPARRELELELEPRARSSFETPSGGREKAPIINNKMSRSTAVCATSRRPTGDVLEVRGATIAELASVQAARGRSVGSTSLAPFQIVKLQATQRQLSSNETTTRLLIAVMLVFLICETPAGVLAALCAIFGQDFFDNVYQPMGIVTDLLALINSSVNFILYCFMSTQFRVTFYQVVLRCPAPNMAPHQHQQQQQNGKHHKRPQ